MKVKIYVLVDPFTLKIRYIGRTRKENLQQRLSEHISKAKYHVKYGRKPSHRYNWINSILEKGKKPIIRCVTIIEGWEESHLFEQQLIKKYALKKKLVNKDDYGSGTVFKIVEDSTRKLISQTLKRKYKSGEVKSPSKKKVFVYNLKGEYLTTFDSLKEASDDLNVSYNTIIRQLNGQHKQAKGYRFSYTKKEQLEDMSFFKKGAAHKVSLMYKGQKLEFPSMLECYSYFDIFGGTTRNLFVNKVTESIPGVSNIHINNKLYTPNIQRKKVSVVFPDSSVVHFSSLKELGIYFELHPGKCYLAEVKRIFETKFTDHQLILSCPSKTPLNGETPEEDNPVLNQ